MQLLGGTQGRDEQRPTGWFLTGYYVMPDTHRDAIHPQWDFISFTVGIFLRLFFPSFGVFLARILGASIQLDVICLLNWKILSGWFLALTQGFSMYKKI